MAYLDSIKTLLIKSIPDIVIKYSNVAAMYETVETKRNGDRYVAAVKKLDTFESYLYDIDCLLAAGFTMAEAKEYSHDRNKIPSSRKAVVLETQRKRIIANYVEENDYYRMLAGLPAVDDIVEIWLDFDIYREYKIPPNPIHKINKDTLRALEKLGKLDDVIAKYPDKKYLRHLGSRRIDIATARLADNFEILYFPRLDNGEIFYRDFVLVYEECREYFLTIIYNKYYGNKYDYYDNYIAFSLLIMVINKMVSVMLLKYVQREFYDTDSLRIFLEAYGIEYNPLFNFSQLKLVAKNLNLLLQTKSTDKVFVDLLSMLGYSNFTVMKYYLIKQHRFDENNKPIFVYKTVTDEEGNKTKVLDEESMYEYSFVRMPIGEYNVQEALMNEENILTYKEVTIPDDYWIDDAKLKEKLASSTFNYIDTKYMDVNIVYKMQSITFETIYLTRLVLDKRDETKTIFINLPSITDMPITLFDTFILLISLMCKYFHIQPDILKSPSKILYILGYNFEADFEAIKKDILNNRDLDNELVTYIKNTYFTSVSDVNNMFVNVRTLQDLLIKRMNETEDIRVYEAYDKIYRTLMWTKLNDQLYEIPGQGVPDQFTDYLAEMCPELYSYYITLVEDDDVAHAIDYVTTKLMTLFNDTKYLKLIRILDEDQLNAIRKLLCFFKSYTINMKDAHLILIMDDRYHNMIHFNSHLKFGADGSIELIIPDSSFLDLVVDALYKEYETVRPEDKINLKLQELYLANIIPKTYVEFSFRPYLSINEKIFDTMDVFDGSKFLNNIDLDAEIYTETKAKYIAREMYKEYDVYENYPDSINATESINTELDVTDRSSFYTTEDVTYNIHMEQDCHTMQKWWHNEFFYPKIVEKFKANGFDTMEVDVGIYEYKNMVDEYIKDSNITLKDSLIDFYYNNFMNTYEINLKTKPKWNSINLKIVNQNINIIGHIETTQIEKLPHDKSIIDDTKIFDRDKYMRHNVDIPEKITDGIVSENISTQVDAIDRQILISTREEKDKPKFRDTYTFIWED